MERQAIIQTQEIIQIADVRDLRSEVKSFFAPLSSAAPRVAAAPSPGNATAGRATAAAGKAPARLSRESVVAESEAEA